ncbi:MAG: HAD family hydrolase [Bifidobacterium sp.]|nr:HAD family hydrolase [Bifidobacterium sp.]
MNAPVVVADLDGTLLHDAPVFEERALGARTLATVERLRAQGVRFAVATARPVSTGLSMVRALHADACIYLNGALVDLDPAHSDFASLTGTNHDADAHLRRIGFPSAKAAELCRTITEAVDDVEIGVVMDDVRYTNFDVTKYWTTQTWRFSDFTDIPDGTADKVIVFPKPGQEETLRGLIPDDFAIQVSEGSMWMLMEPRANKGYTTRLLCDAWGVDPDDAIAFGDDVIDIDMMELAGTGVAVANANPQVLAIADEVAPSNNEDGVAQWIERHLLH